MCDNINNTLRNGISAARLGIAGISSNLANAETDGFREIVTSFSESSGSGVNVHKTRNFDAVTSYNESDSNTAIAINGRGLLVAKAQISGEGGRRYISTGDFALNKNNIMASNGYSLLGRKYGTDGKLSAELKEIKIDDTLNASASTEMLLDLSLSGSTIVDSGGGVVVASIETGANKIIIPTDSKLLNSSFDVIITKDNGTNITKNVSKYTFGGMIQGSSLSNTGTELSSSTGNFSIFVDNQSVGNIAITDITPGADNAVALGEIQTKLNAMGLRTDIVANNTTNKSSLVIAPSNSNSSLEFRMSTGSTLLSNLGMQFMHVPPADSSINRFLTLNELKAKIADKFTNVRVYEGPSGTSSNLFFEAKNGAYVFLANSNTNVNLLGELGIVNNEEACLAIKSTYDPYSDERYVGGSDYSTDVLIRDSKGTAHIFNAEFNKITDSQWIMRLSAADPVDIVTNGNNGVVQVSKLSFGSSGELFKVEAVPVSYYSVGVDPLVSLGSSGDTFQINSTTFSIGTGAGNFTNMLELVNLINNDSSAIGVTASIVDQNSSYKLCLTPNDLNTQVSVQGKVADLLEIHPAIEGGPLPTIDDVLTINWRGSDPAPLPSVINTIYQEESVRASAAFNRAKLDTDGYAAGARIGLDISANGDVVGVYDNGMRLPQYKIAIALFPNEKGLEPADDGYYKESTESGKVILETPEEGGAGNILSRYLASSGGGDIMKSLSHAEEFKIQFDAMLRVLQLSQQMNEKIAARCYMRVIVRFEIKLNGSMCDYEGKLFFNQR